MANEISTVQSLKAVDAWIDVINANINGGVRTAFKSSRLKFGGSNVNIGRAGNATSLPLQIPETGLITANTVIDFSQGAITASTENVHLAVQGEGFFLLLSPDAMQLDGATTASTAATKMLVTRDGEFHTNQNGVLVHSSGYFLVTYNFMAGNRIEQTSGNFGLFQSIRAVYNNLDTTANATVATNAIRLSDYLTGSIPTTATLANGATTLTFQPATSLMKIQLGKQNLQYSQFGSTVFDFGYNFVTGGASPAITLAASTSADSTILNKSLEASNASMTQSVPELSLAQKLFSALTKVLQISQTNTDAVLNLIR